ncbi:MAG: oxygenase MpaB family protein [Cyanobium sp.]
MSTSPPRLDGEALAICRQLAGLTFPWDITRSLELALLKTFCVPSISGLLHTTGEFERRPRKRYDDTALMVAELLRHGPDSPIGSAVISRMNRIHGHYAIGNDDYIYVLSTFVAEPIRWLERYGWRPLTPSEEQALFRFWWHVGGLMDIRDVPTTLDGLMAWNQRVEDEVFRVSPTNQLVAEATLAMLLNDWPTLLHPALAGGLRGLLDPAVTASLGWPPAPSWWRELLRAGLRIRSRGSHMRQHLQPSRPTRFYSQQPTRSYGAQFALDQLGPPPLLERLNASSQQSPQDE